MAISRSQEEQSGNLKQLQDLKSRSIEWFQLQFKEFADAIKKLVKFKFPVINENEGSRDNVESWIP
jgi:hypothetical protein